MPPAQIDSPRIILEQIKPKDSGRMDQSKIEKLQNVKDVANTLGVGISTVWLMAKEHRFPAPLKISKGATRWKQSEVQAFINGTWNG